MSDHTRVARLAATALDFDLTPGERAELDLHLAACARCRQIDDDFRADAAVLHRLPRLDAPSQLRQAVAEAAWHEEVPHRNRTGLILIVAAILMLAMAVGGGIAASQWLQRDDDATQPFRTFGSLPSDRPLAEGPVSLLVDMDVAPDDLVARAVLVAAPERWHSRSPYRALERCAVTPALGSSSACRSQPITSHRRRQCRSCGKVGIHSARPLPFTRHAVGSWCCP